MFISIHPTHPILARRENRDRPIENTKTRSLTSDYHPSSIHPSIRETERGKEAPGRARERWISRDGGGRVTDTFVTKNGNHMMCSLSPNLFFQIERERESDHHHDERESGGKGKGCNVKKVMIVESIKANLTGIPLVS